MIEGEGKPREARGKGRTRRREEKGEGEGQKIIKKERKRFGIETNRETRRENVSGGKGRRKSEE